MRRDEAVIAVAASACAASNNFAVGDDRTGGVHPLFGLRLPAQLAGAFVDNLSIYLSPSSRYSAHVIVDRLPWRSAYDAIVSFPVFPLLLIGSVLLWLSRTAREGWWRAVGLCLPVAFLAFVSILFDRGENMRFKFFIEPVLFVFVASQVWVAGRAIKRRVRARSSARRAYLRFPGRRTKSPHVRVQ